MRRKQILMAAAGLLAVAFCGWNVWRLLRRLGEATAARQQRDVVREQLEGFYRLNPFPNETNRALAAQDRDRLKGWVRELGEELVETNAPISLSPIRFMQDVKREVERLAALKSSSGAWLAAPGFAFGFERYVGDDGRMPQPEDIPRLALHLQMVSQLCHELTAAGVQALVGVRREETAATVADTRAGLRRPHGRAAAAMGTGKHHFTFEFLACKNALLETLNRLAAMELFVVVSDISVRKSGDDLKSAPEPALDADGGRRAAPDPLQRVVSGPQVAPPLLVRLELDVYVFEEV